MAENADHRKLAAILCADVKGYSKLMGEDESYTVSALKACRKVFADNIQTHGGRVVNAPGDSILAEFSSVVSAVQCAVAIQNQLNDRNTELPDNRKMVFRIGVNLGDVIQSEDAIYGDGVNIAARIEALAEPGGVSISRTVFNQVRNKLPCGYEYQGEHQVKNIFHPVKVYKLLTASEDAGKLVGMEPTVSASKWVWPTALVAAVIVTLIGYQVYHEIAGSKFEPASVEKMAFPLPDKPSIAVLPFVNLSGDDNQEYLIDGFTEDLITTITKVPSLFVISRQSSFTYKGKNVPVKTVAEELGVHYVLEGSVQKSGDKIRINVQLIDALKGYHKWSERYDRLFDDIFKLKDDIILNVSTELAVELSDGERARVLAHYTNNLESWEAYLLATTFVRRFTKASMGRARELFTKALSLDPTFLPSLMGLAFTHWFDARFGYSDSPERSFAAAIDLANKAITIDSAYFEPHLLLSQIYLMKREFDKAETNLAQARRCAPNDHHFHAMHGLILNYLGEPHRAIEALKTAMRLSPYYPAWYLYHLGLSYHLIGQHEEAIELLKKGIERAPDQLAPRFRLVAVYSDLDRMKAAKAEVSKILNIKSDVSMEIWHKANPWKDPVLVEHRKKLLRKAGLPDNPRQQESEKPSIAVLPFENMSGDPDQQFFSDGFTEQIITSISKVPYITVIARQSSFVFRNSERTVQQIAEELGVKYILEGSLQRSGDQLRINAQLIDAASGHHIWADHYDRDLNDIFEVQDEISKKLMVALQVKLTAGEAARLGAETTSIKAYEKFLQGVEKYQSRTQEDILIARQFFQEAINLDPRYAVAYIMVGWSHLDDVWMGRTKTPVESIAKAEAMAQKAISIHGLTTDENALLAGVHVLKRDFDKALTYGEKAVEQCPNCAGAQQLLGFALRYKGQYDMAILRIKKAIQLEPVKNIIYLSNLAWCYLYSGQYEQAIATWNETLARNSDYLFAYLGLTAAYWWSGSEDQARESARQVLRVHPEFSIGYYEKLNLLSDKDLSEQLFNAWRQAGLK